MNCSLCSESFRTLPSCLSNLKDKPGWKMVFHRVLRFLLGAVSFALLVVTLLVVTIFYVKDNTVALHSITKRVDFLRDKKVSLLRHVW